jgi:adenylate kinase
MNTEKQFFIMIGRSGCGKGTQAQLIKSYFENLYAESGEIKHITTGGAFREFINSDSYTSQKSKEIINEGGLMPEFLAIWNWSNIFVENMSGNESVILDGAPRKLIEVQALDSAISFYNYKKPIVIYIDVTKDWAVDRLTERGREDDKNQGEVNRKMDWFENDVKKVIDWYSEDPKYSFIHINGEGEIEKVHTELIIKINNLTQ